MYLSLIGLYGIKYEEGFIVESAPPTQILVIFSRKPVPQDPLHVIEKALKIGGPVYRLKLKSFRRRVRCMRLNDQIFGDEATTDSSGLYWRCFLYNLRSKVDLQKMTYDFLWGWIKKRGGLLYGRYSIYVSL
jgi:hypothetical protein